VPPTPNFFETRFDQTASPNYLLNLRSTAAADKWLTTRRKFWWNAPLPKAFGVLFYLHKTSTSQPYRAVHPTQ
jgi:hypothetical protein